MDADTVAAGALEEPLAGLLLGRLQARYAVANPAAGSDWSIAVPAGVVWLVHAITARLVTSAVVANRSVDLQVTTADGALVAAVPPQASQAASLSGFLFWLRTIRSAWAPGANKQAIPVPALFTVGGQIVKTSTLNLDVGDQWSQIVLSVVEVSQHNALQQAEWIAERLKP